jgi:hypothetical protein
MKNMTRFEEDVVECYYNLKEYLTIKNIQFPAVKKRPGGKGRGEIDLLAVKVGNTGRVKDAVWVEIGVSVSSRFPFISRTRPEGVDEVRKLLKKYFESDAEHKIKKLLKGLTYNRRFVSSDFSPKTKDNLVNRLAELGAGVVSVNEKKNTINIRIRFKNLEKSNIERDIEIVPFSEILLGLRRIFDEEGLKTRDFQDPRLRAIQYLVAELNKT